MNRVSTLLTLFIFCVLFGCSTDVKGAKCEINVKQGITNIPYGSGSFNFGNIPVGLSQSITFTIENVGVVDLHLTDNPVIEVIGQNASDFTADTNITASTIAAESETTFKIQFKPASLGSKSATVSIANDDPKRNPYTFTILGTCTQPAPEIHVKQGVTDILCATDTYNFGTVGVNIETEKVTFTIENNGNEMLHLTGPQDKIAIEDSDKDMFIIKQNQTSSQIAGSNSTTFEVSFKPTSAGVKTAKISIPNNDSDENPYTFTITGTGIASPEINVKQGSTNILNSTGSYDFGKIGIGLSSSEITFTIENLGIGDLMLNGSAKIAKTGTDASLFDIDQSLTDSTIYPATSTTFKIKFSPTSVGDFTASIVIENNDLDEDPYTFELKGQGYISQYCWTKHMGSSEDDLGFFVTTDSSGNIYITGSFQNAVNFGHDFGVSDIKTSKGYKDIFVTKINANGTYGWTKQIGGIYIDGCSTIKFDSSGNIYLTGIFHGPVDFGLDFGVSDIKPKVGDLDLFLTKINANGSYGWTKQIGGSKSVLSNSLAISSDCVYLTGDFEGTANFGADFGRSDVKTAVGDTDIFVTKIGLDGWYYWTAQFGGQNYDRGYSITTDSSGSSYTTGYFAGTVNFGADFGISDSKTNGGCFITKINTNGSYGWTKQITTTTGYSIVCDDSDNVYVSGSFYGTVDFGIDFGASESKSSIGDTDVFVTKINSNDSYAWTKRIGGFGDDRCRGITIDAYNDIYLTGSFESTVDFGSDFSVSESKTSNGMKDIFITKINSNCTYSWTKCFGSSDDDIGISCNVDTSGNIFITGYFKETVNFGADFGVSDSKTSAGDYDIFVTKLTK